MKRSAFCAALVLILLPPTSAQTHEFWIEPEAYRPEPGSMLRIGLHVGHRFTGETYAYDPDRIEKFALFSADGQRPVIGRSGAESSFARVETAGLHVIGYRSKRAHIELEAAKFESYLHGEGLKHIVQLRAKRGESNKAGREVYSRCAKSLICAGSPGGTSHDRALGYPLEIIPVQNPYSLQPGANLTVRVLHDGRPLPGATIVAVDKKDQASAALVISNEHGQATFKLTTPGPWLITTIHMVPAPAGLDADWESFWASLTFELPG